MSPRLVKNYELLKVYKENEKRRVISVGTAPRCGIRCLVMTGKNVAIRSGRGSGYSAVP